MKDVAAALRDALVAVLAVSAIGMACLSLDKPHPREQVSASYVAKARP